MPGGRGAGRRWWCGRVPYPRTSAFRLWRLLRSSVGSRQETYRSAWWGDIHRKLDRGGRDSRSTDNDALVTTGTSLAHSERPSAAETRFRNPGANLDQVQLPRPRHRLRAAAGVELAVRSEEHTSELQSRQY